MFARPRRDDPLPMVELDERNRAETAAFRGDDPSCLVAAGLACRVCLADDVAWALELEPWDNRARTRCRKCGHERTVSLTPEQGLRLSLEGDHPEHAAPAPLFGLALVV
jgi:hypothetical protein